MPRNGGDRWFNTEHETSLSDHASNYLDYSDKRALMDQIIIDFYRDGTGNSIAFKAFITGYSEAYEAIKSEAPVDVSKVSALDLGNLNAVRRSITLSWKTVAASFEEARDNMKRCSELIQMVYPKPNTQSGGNSVGGRSGELNPGGSSSVNTYDLGLFKVRFAQWLVDPRRVDGDDPGSFAPADTTGLQCNIPSLTYSPDLEEGSFDGPNGFFPKVINLSCTIIAQDDTGKGKPEGWQKYPHGYKGFENEGQTGPPPTLDDSGGDHDEHERASEALLLSGANL